MNKRESLEPMMKIFEMSLHDVIKELLSLSLQVPQMFEEFWIEKKNLLVFRNQKKEERKLVGL